MAAQVLMHYFETRILLQICFLECGKAQSASSLTRLRVCLLYSSAMTSGPEASSGRLSSRMRMNLGNLQTFGSLIMPNLYTSFAASLSICFSL